MLASFITSALTRARARFLLALSLGLGSSACELVLGEIPAEFELLDSGVSGYDDDPDDDVDSDPSDQEFEPSPSRDGGGTTDTKAPEPLDPDENPLPTMGDCAQPVAWYADQDGDGYGAGPAQPACEKPGNAWSKQRGDCADNDPLVFPGQKAFFGTPYVRTNGTESFDYDCSGNEAGNPSQSLEPRCETMPGPKCGASGYAKSARIASGANAYCGSHTLESCVSTITVVLCKSTTETVATPYACH